MHGNLATLGGIDNVAEPGGRGKSYTCGAWLFPDDAQRLIDLQQFLDGASASEVFRRALECLHNEMNKPTDRAGYYHDPSV